MATRVTIQLDQQGQATVLTKAAPAPVQVKTSYVPQLPPTIQSVWNPLSSGEKNTFVDANDAELLTFFDTALLALSTDATTAITNIESNGGTLTSKEKYFVGIWVDRMQADGEWALLDHLLYGGFDDDICKLTDWKAGRLATNNGCLLTSDGYDSQGTGYIANGFLPVTNGVNYKAGDAIGGLYIHTYRSGTELMGSYYYSGGAYTAILLMTNIYHVNGGASGAYTNTNPWGRSLVSAKELSTGTWSRSMQSNGEGLGAGIKNHQGRLHNAEQQLFDVSGQVLAQLNGIVSMCFYGGGIGFSEDNLYAGFEDFRTSLHPEILYNMPAPTGQVTSYRTGDDPDIESKLFQHYRKAQKYWKGTRPVLVDFLTLQDNNAFGSTSRFTDSEGGQIYGAGNGSLTLYKIDHYTGLGVHKGTIYNQNDLIWTAIIDAYLGTAFGGSGTYQATHGYTDWFVSNVKQARSIMNYLSGFLYAPFSNNSGDRMYWTSSSTGSRAFFVRGNWSVSEGTESLGAGWVNSFYQFRKHY